VVDNKKIGFTQAVDVSFLTDEEQQWVLMVLKEKKGNISTAQSGELKELSKRDELTLPKVRMILEISKPKERNVVIKRDKILRYFPEHIDCSEIERIILQLLEEWKNRI